MTALPTWSKTPPNSSPTKTAATTTHEAMTHHLVCAFFMLLLSIDGAEATTPGPIRMELQNLGYELL
jgi:hypothetical protein